MTEPRALRLSLIARLASGGDSHDVSASTVHGTRGPDEAVDDLVAAHADAVYRYALRLARDPQRAADLAQETLLRGWRARHKLRQPAAARVWLLRIATNLHRDELRTARPALTLVNEEPDRRIGDGRRLEELESVHRALAALDELPPRQRQVMHLVTIEQLSHENAAAVLGISADALKASLFAARRQMREKLKDIFDEIRGARTEHK